MKSYDLCELADAIPHIEVEAPAQKSPSNGTHHQNGLDRIARAAAWMKKRDPAISDQHGDSHTFSTAAALVNDFGLSKAQAWPLLLEWNVTCPPRSHEVLQQKLDNAADYAKNPPGCKADAKARENNTTTSAATIQRGYKLTCLADVEPEEVDHLWKDRIAIGKLTLFVGDPCSGKSTTTMDIAARVSTGTGFPDCRTTPNPVGSVVILSAEDGIADTIRKRADAAGADPRKIHVLEAVKQYLPEGERLNTFSLETDLPILDAVLADNPDTRLVIIDPVSAYMGGKVDSHNNTDVRGILAPLAEIASRRRVALIMVTHMTKAGGGSAMYRATGSLAFVAAARSAWLIVKDKDDERRRLMLPIKNNLAPPVDGLAFTIEPTPQNVGVVMWDATPVKTGADEALSDGKGQDRSERDECKDWLQFVLSKGRVEAGEVKGMAQRAGFTTATVRRAKEELQVTFEREGFGKDCKTFWRLP